VKLIDLNILDFLTSLFNLFRIYLSVITSGLGIKTAAVYYVLPVAPLLLPYGPTDAALLFTPEF